MLTIFERHQPERRPDSFDETPFEELVALVTKGGPDAREAMNVLSIMAMGTRNPSVRATVDKLDLDRLFPTSPVVE